MTTQDDIYTKALEALQRFPTLSDRTERYNALSAVTAWASRHECEYGAKLIGLSADEMRKAHEWYLEHECAGLDRSTAFAVARGMTDAAKGQPLYRIGVTGGCYHYEYHPSSIGSMVRICCQLCKQTETISDCG